MRSWRWSLSATATATASPISPCYSCRFRVPLSLTNFSFSTPSISSSSCKISAGLQFQHLNRNSNSSVRKRKELTGFEAAAWNIVKCTSGTNTELGEQEGAVDFDCVGTGQDVECVVSSPSSDSEESVALSDDDSAALGKLVWEWAVLVSPFFFWGTAMVAMKEVIPKCGPFFVSAFRLIPAGFLLVAFAASRNRPFPSGLTAWLSISLFALVDATCFQVTLFICIVFGFRNNKLSHLLVINDSMNKCCDGGTGFSRRRVTEDIGRFGQCTFYYNSIHLKVVTSITLIHTHRRAKKEKEKDVNFIISKFEFFKSCVNKPFWIFFFFFLMLLCSILSKIVLPSTRVLVSK
jgi:hypothetical protein